MSGTFLIPGVTQTSDNRVAKVAPAVIEKLAPTLGVLLPQCVPSPFAQATVMAAILPAIGPGTTNVEPQYPAEQRQSFATWQLLVKAMFLGRVLIENVSLNPQGLADNFGAALMRSRNRKTFQGILRCEDIPRIIPVDRKSRVVGGVDEFAFVWGAPRMRPDEWVELRQRITGADEVVALDLIYAWRAMLIAKKLWPDQANEQPWNHGINVMLDGHKPTATWEQLQPNARMTGPVRLFMSPSAQSSFFADVFIPVFSPGYVSEFQKVFQLCPVTTEGGQNLVDENAPSRVGFYVQLSATTRRADAEGNAPSANNVADDDELLAGLGSVTPIERNVSGVRSWLQDRERPGYYNAVYTPLLRRVLAIQSARVPLKEDEIETCPIFFPDALRVPWRQLNPPEGMSVVDCDYFRSDRFRELTRLWPLPEYGMRLADNLEAPASANFVVALEHTPSAPSLVERLDRGDQTFIDVGEVRALGALLWELFIGDASFKPAPSVVIESRSRAGAKIASQWREAEPRLEFKEELLSAVGSALARQSAASESYRRAVRQRRATAQRFMTLWKKPPVAGVDGWLGALAARVFLDWVFDDPTFPLEGWGATPDCTRVPERRLQVTRTVAVPVFTDVYPRSGLKGAA